MSIAQLTANLTTNLTTMKTTYLTAVGIIMLLILSACSESDQSAVGDNSVSADKSEVGTDVYESKLPPVADTVDIDAAQDSFTAEGSSQAEGSLQAEGSFTADGSFQAEGSADTNFAVIDSVTSQLELASEQKSVAELEQSTEAANQALRNLAEQKTVKEAENLAAEQAESISPGKEDVATPLAQNSLSVEPSTEALPDPIAKSSTVEPQLTEEPAIVAPSSLRTFDPIRGDWTKKSQKIAGQWLIETRDGQAFLVLGDDFKTRNAPDLKFVLSNTSVSDVTNKNAMNNALFVANLKSPSGEQIYVLPENFHEYSTLLLHCEKYTKLWGAAAIDK